MECLMMTSLQFWYFPLAHLRELNGVLVWIT